MQPHGVGGAPVSLEGTDLFAIKQRLLGQQSLKLEQGKKPVLWGGFLSSEQKGAGKNSPALPSGLSRLKLDYNLLIPILEGLEYNS